ncbi:YwiC-like family protein [Testudinibacter sp. P27/CKL/0425]
MKLLISNQHGAIVMALLPFLYGMLSSNPVWQHLFLLLAWCCLYLFTYPFFNLFKGRNLGLNRQWCWRYGVTALLFVLPALAYNWRVLYFLLAMLPFGLLNIYYVKQKDERALGNDLAAIAIFGLAGMAAYYFAEQAFDRQIGLVFLYPSLFFIGTTLYVKSVLRERKNPRYLQLSIAFHAASLLIVALIDWQTALCFLPPLLRAVIAPRYKLSVKQVGLLEFAVSGLFLLGLLIQVR